MKGNKYFKLLPGTDEKQLFSFPVEIFWVTKKKQLLCAASEADGGNISTRSYYRQGVLWLFFFLLFCFAILVSCLKQTFSSIPAAHAIAQFVFRVYLPNFITDLECESHFMPLCLVFSG